MFLYRLRIVIEDDIGNARRIELLHRLSQSFIIPDAEDNQIGIGGDDFFNGKRAVFGIANIGNLFQFRQRFFIKRVLLRPPVFPGGKGKGDDLVHRILAANGKIIFIIKTEHDALRHFGYGDGATNDVGSGDFGKGGGGGGECQRGGEQELLHVNLLNAREKGAGNGTRDYRVTRR